ncbi:MAG: hypothetical protein UIL37_03625 [Clostridia bacterium]|nr:hypothetical protein [Clostridia bacterium]
MMKKRVSIIIAGVLLLFVAGSLAAQPGTDGDPLVTKSYIDGVVYPYIDTASTFKLVTLKAGTSAVCDAGTELILRMGSCSVVGTASGGLSDVTMGYDLPSGTEVQGNHLLVTPVGDGRGVKASSDCLILIKGYYTVK